MACTASTSVARSHRELLEECMCAICRSILIHPVTLPCHHEMCMPCFKQTVEEASLCCPLCRTRISTWARRASKANALVDERRWKEIQSLFPVKVQRRLNGLDDESDDDDESEDISAHYRRMIHLSKPGEIRQEYEEELKRLTAQQEEERRTEEAASEALIQRLQNLEEEEAEEVRRQQEELEAQDEELARGLAEAVSAENSPGTTITPVRSSLSRKSSTDSSDLILVSSGLQERGKKQLCTKEGSKTLETFFRRLPPGVKPVSRCSSLTHDFASTSHLDKWLKDSIPDRPVSAPVSSKASEEDLTKQCQKKHSACETWEHDFSEGKPVKHSVVIHPPPSSLPTCSKYLSGKVNLQSVLEEKSPEDEVLTLSHFRPIQACPRTPPKSLPSGHPLEPTVVCLTPRVLITGTEQQAATSAFVKGPGCAERENREKGKTEGGEDSGHNMGSTMSRFLGHDDENEAEMNGIDEVSSDFGAKNKQVFKKVEEKRSKSSSPMMFNTIHEDSYASVERNTYARPPINDYRERSHHSPVNRVDSPTFLLKFESRDCENVFGERNVQENGERSPEPKPSTSDASRPVGIFNPATVPPWTEGLYCEKGKGASRPQSPSGLSNGATEGQSPVGKGKACGKKRAKNSSKKSGRDNSDNEEAAGRPAKVRKLSPLGADDESTVYSLVHAATGTVKGTGGCLLKGVKQTSRDKAGHQKAVKLKSKKAVDVKNAKGKPARVHSKKSHLVSKPTAVYVDFIGSLNNLPAVNGENVLDSDRRSSSKTSIISISSESSAASEVKVVENGSKKRSQERKRSTSGNNKSISQPANSPAAEADTDAQAKGPQRTIKDWFSPKPTKRQGQSSNTHVLAATGTVNSGRIHKKVRANRSNSNAALKSDGSADKKGRHSKSASVPSTDVSHTVSNVLYASSTDASPDGKSARAKVVSRSRKLKSECSCCPTDTYTLNKLDKYLKATSHQSPSKSKSKLSPSKNLTPSKKLTFPKSKDLTPSKKLSPFKNSIHSKHSTPSKKSASSKHSTPTKRQKLKLDNDSDHDVSPSRSALSRNGGINDDDKNFLSYSDDGTEDKEGLTQEEKDMRLAMRLQAEFDMADRLQMNVIRFKGSDNEYSLRRGQPQSKLLKD